MIWNEKFDAVHIPSYDDIREYLGVGKTSWDEFTVYIEEEYQVKPMSRGQCRGDGVVVN